MPSAMQRAGILMRLLCPAWSKFELIKHGGDGVTELFAITQVTVIFFVLAFSMVFTLQSRVGEQLVAYLKSLPSQLQKCLGNEDWEREAAAAEGSLSLDGQLEKGDCPMISAKYIENHT